MSWQKIRPLWRILQFPSLSLTLSLQFNIIVIFLPLFLSLISLSITQKWRLLRRTRPSKRWAIDYEIYCNCNSFLFLDCFKKIRNFDNVIRLMKIEIKFQEARVLEMSTLIQKYNFDFIYFRHFVFIHIFGPENSRLNCFNKYGRFYAYIVNFLFSDFVWKFCVFFSEIEGLFFGLIHSNNSNSCCVHYDLTNLNLDCLWYFGKLKILTNFDAYVCFSGIWRGSCSREETVDSQWLRHRKTSRQRKVWSCLLSEREESMPSSIVVLSLVSPMCRFWFNIYWLL